MIIVQTEIVIAEIKWPRCTVVRNSNLMFIIGYRSYFLTDFKFCFLEILSIKFLRESSIANFKFLSQSNNT